MCLGNYFHYICCIFNGNSSTGFEDALKKNLYIFEKKLIQNIIARRKRSMMATSQLKPKNLQQI